MKYVRVSFRLDDDVNMELEELCESHDVSKSTMIRALLKLGIDEVRKTVSSQKTPL